MTKNADRTSRREFLRQLGAASAALVASRLAFAFPRVGDSGALDFLVVGDSLVWGQGLEEKDKFYSHTAEWLRTAADGSPRAVDLKVKAHSGSTLKFHPNEAEAYKKAGRDEAYYYKPEVNVGFPSILKQIEVAAEEYRTAGKERGADLIMLTGGITDISVATLLDPFGDDKLLYPMIEKYCRDDMFDVLEHAAGRNPNAMIAVIGYFPMVSPKTDGGKLFNIWLESMGFPRALKSVVNNPLSRGVFFQGIRKKSIRRSRIWLSESTKHLQAAVDKLNAKFEIPRAVFIPSPITEDTCFETPNTLLFRMGKNGRSEDGLFAQRQAECRQALPELKKATRLNYPIRYCEIAGAGHPDPAGSRAYSDAIKTALAPMFRQAQS